MYHRSAEGKAPFKTESFNLISRQLVTGNHLKKFSKSPLVFGTTLDLSETSAALGKRLRTGIELRFDKENQESGINGHPLEMVFLDDHYTPRTAKQNVLELIKNYHTSIIVAPLGTPTTEAFLPLAEDKEILILFPYTGAMIFRKPTLTHVINLRASYASEAKALVDYAVNTLQARRLALFYQDDSYGLAPLEGARAELKKLGIKEWSEVGYTRNNPNVTAAAQKIATFNPDAILFFSTPAPSKALIMHLGINNVASTLFMGISFLTDVFRTFLKGRGLSIIMARVMPNPEDTSYEIVRDYQKALKGSSIESFISVDSLEGYINASVLIDALKSIKGPVTQEALIEKIEGLKDYPYKGLTLNFNPETRELLSDVWIDTGVGPWIPWNQKS